MKPYRVLGIESSCDDCSAALVEIKLESESVLSSKVLSLKTFSQNILHGPYGGVVPEIASRSHLEEIHSVVQNALKGDFTLDTVDCIAVTNRPGLVGSLLVGISVAKTLAYIYKKPLVAVHHLEGHLLSPFLDLTVDFQSVFPQLSLLVSGGHTQLHAITTAPPHWDPEFLTQSRLGRSLDDAAGEAFDKTAKLLGFPYPGGHHLDLASENGDPHRFKLPRHSPSDELNFDFSFSGLKTSVLQLTQKQELEGTLEENKAHLAASIQEAIVETLIIRLKKAVNLASYTSVAVVGGVAANRSLKKKITSQIHLPLYSPKPEYCTDNAAMIALAGGLRFKNLGPLSSKDALELSAIPYPDQEKHSA